MRHSQKLTHPATLETGVTYMLRDFQPRDRKIAWVPVSFVSYAACPGIVIVAYNGGPKLTVAREDLFSAGSFQD